MKRLRFVASLAGIASALGLAACDRPINEDECGQLLDHYTDKVIDQTRSKASQGERRQMIQEARQKAKLDPEFSECPGRVSRAAFQCALSAQSADQIERCLL